MTGLRIDWHKIADWVPSGAKVLDLGCGGGDLLAYLMDHKHIKGLGLEIDPKAITACIRRGVAVVEQDLNQGLKTFRDQSQHTVVMTHALQMLERPDQLLMDMLRVAQQAIITLPNFGYWRHRLQLLLTGRMPVSTSLPHPWYATPNIHLCTLNDFESLCRQRGMTLLDKQRLNIQGKPSFLGDFWANGLCAQTIYRVTLANN